MFKNCKDFYRDILTVFPEYKDKLKEFEIEFLTEDKHERNYTHIVLKTIHNTFLIYYIKIQIFSIIMKH